MINVNKLIKPHYAQIWQTIQLIPQGKVACYGQIADLAGLPGRARLVGKALGNVPESGWRGQAVPCIGSSMHKEKYPFLSEVNILKNKNSFYKMNKW